MNELISIKKHDFDGVKINSINARELWIYLESKQRFTDWIKNRIEKYDFSENLDYTVHKIMNTSTQLIEAIEYIITIDMAKELAMLENNNKGKMARRYFIQMEKKFKQLAPASYEEAVFQLADALKEKQLLQATNNEKTKLIEAQANKLEQEKPYYTYAHDILDSNDTMTISDFLRTFGLSAKIINPVLRNNGILLNRQGTVASIEYIRKGWFVNIEHSYTSSNGKKRVSQYSKLTQLGKQKLYHFLNKKEYIKSSPKDIKLFKSEQWVKNA